MCDDDDDDDDAIFGIFEVEMFIKYESKYYRATSILIIVLINLV